MTKKIFTTVLIFLLIGCGFKPLLKDFDSSKIFITKINYKGKNELTYLLQNSLGLSEKKGLNGLVINLDINENLIPASKNNAGIVIEEDLIINIKLEIKDSEFTNLTSDILSGKKRLRLTDNLSTDATTKNIERIKLIQNLSQQIKFKLLILSDNFK